MVGVPSVVLPRNELSPKLSKTTPLVADHPINLSLTHCLVEANIVGIQSTGQNSTVWLAQSTLTGNAAGFFAFNGRVINSFSDNYITPNGSKIGTLTPVGKQKQSH